MARLIREWVDKEGIIQLNVNPIGELFSDSEYSVNVHVCENPLCECGTGHIEIIKDNSAEVVCNLPIDIDNEKVKPVDHIESIDKQFNEDFINELFSTGLTSEDWFSLRKIYYQTKFYIGELANPDELQYDFSYKDYVDDSLMFMYRDIFPYSSFTEEFDDKQYVIFDNYCKNPHCECGDMFLDIVEVGEKNEEGIRVTKSIGLYHYNYKNKKVNITDVTDISTVKAIVAKLFERFNGIDKIFERRNQVLRKIYKKSRMQFNFKQQKSLPVLGKKVGRNEPCPCGSGKKYKKCCLK